MKPLNLNLTNPNLLKTQCLTYQGWTNANNGDTFAVYNPFNQQKIAEVPSISSEEMAEIIAQSATAQKQWEQSTTAEKRSRILHKWADLIDENIDDLALILTTEQGKPLAEAVGEIRYANSFIRWFAEEGKRVYGDVIPAKANSLRYVTLKQAVGVCAVITPWNFPSAMITRKVAPALAVGCSVIIKPDEDTPLSALALAELAVQAGVPKGVIQVITGNPQKIGQALCESPTVRKLSFTGSTDVGRTLMAQCSPTLKKLSMELGGNAPFIVFADADLEEASTGLLESKYRNAGQTCICANRVFLHESIKDEFLAIFSKKVQALKVGNGLEKGVDIGVLINEQALEKAQYLYQDAIDKGAKCVIGGEVHSSAKLAYQPTILTDVNENMAIAHEEIFAPITAIQTFTSEEEVLQRANDCPVGLASYFYTQDFARAWRMSEQLEYGMVGHNTGLISNEVAPFGGIKQSGFGREGSKYGIEEYLTVKYWCSKVASL